VIKTRVEKVTKEDRIKGLMRLSEQTLVDMAPELGFRNIQFKKIDSKDASKNKKRSKEDIASLIYYKELELQ